ncbi:outer membrane protein assembly factor BamC [Denitrificimonas caeni]|uniref:outer membrane protein assembly factor BamC n=1 Tax=Denitrificimonas caeni TaxID=521720 RepID=UPI0019662F80|nr:outer membrane protein assembly factor BamC [Denitrificimonas caeni]
MKRFAGICLLAVSASSLTGCGLLWGKEGYFRDRGGDYLDARPTPAMQLPEGVQVKHLDPLLPIPHRIASAAAVAEYKVPRPESLPVSAYSGDFSVQKSGPLSWVVAQRIPAQVWPVAQQFFEDNGFKIADERPHLGEFTTEWQAASELNTSLVRQVWGSAPSDLQTRFRVRIEPGVQRNSSEVFIDQAQRSTTSTMDAAWSSNTVTAAEADGLLSELNGYLEKRNEKGDSFSLLASKTYDTPKRVTLVDGGNGAQVLRLDASFERAWSSVGRALEAADIGVVDLNRSTGLYYIDLAQGAKQDEPGFFKRLFSSKKKTAETVSKERYIVRLTAINQQVFVNVERDLDTLAPADISLRILEQLRTHLD